MTTSVTSSVQQYNATQSGLQQGSVYQSAPLQQFNAQVAQSVPVQGQVNTFAQEASAAGFEQVAQSTPIPQLVPKLTTKIVAAQPPITRPVQFLGASTVQGQNTSQTLSVTYRPPTTTIGKVLPPIHATPKVSQLPPEQQPGENRQPIFEKAEYKRNEINVAMARQSQTLQEIHRSNEVQGGTLAPISNKPMVLQETRSGPITKPPQYDKASVKVVDVPVNGGVLPQKFLNPRTLKPTFTNLPNPQTIRREPVVLKENVVNVPALPPQFRPARVQTVPAVYSNNQLQGTSASISSTTQGGEILTSTMGTNVQGFQEIPASNYQTSGSITALGGTDLFQSGAQGWSASAVSGTGTQGLNAAQGLASGVSMGAEAWNAGVQELSANTNANTLLQQFPGEYQQQGQTFQSSSSSGYQTSSSFQVGPTSSTQQYFQSSSSSVQPGQIVTNFATTQ